MTPASPCRIRPQGSRRLRSPLPRSRPRGSGRPWRHHEQGDGAAFGQPAAVVGELHADLVLAGGNGLGGLGEEVLNAEEVVAVLEPALESTPATRVPLAAWRPDHRCSCPLGGSGAAAPSGALRAIDSSARPRSWRPFGPRRLRRQSELTRLPPRVVLHERRCGSVASRVKEAVIATGAAPNFTGDARKRSPYMRGVGVGGLGWRRARWRSRTHHDQRAGQHAPDLVRLGEQRVGHHRQQRPGCERPHRARR